MRAPVVPTFAPPPRRRSPAGLAASVAFHALLLFIILSPLFRRYHLFSATGSDLPGTGGGGGSGEQYIALPALRPFAARPPAPPEVKIETPVVTPPIVPPKVIPPPTPAPDTLPSHPAAPPSDSAGGASATGNGPGQGGGTGGGSGGGQGTGTGGGAGPGTGGGERGRPPEQRQMIVPPTEGTPKPLRGKSVVVRFYVNSNGGVDRIETDPEIPDGSFRNLFLDLMRGFKFRPARDSLGIPVAGVTSAIVTLSTK